MQTTTCPTHHLRVLVLRRRTAVPEVAAVRLLLPAALRHLGLVHLVHHEIVHPRQLAASAGPELAVPAVRLVASAAAAEPWWERLRVPASNFPSLCQPQFDQLPCPTQVRRLQRSSLRRVVVRLLPPRRQPQPQSLLRNCSTLVQGLKPPRLPRRRVPRYPKRRTRSRTWVPSSSSSPLRSGVSLRQRRQLARWQRRQTSYLKRVCRLARFRSRVRSSRRSPFRTRHPCFRLGCVRRVRRVFVPNRPFVLAYELLPPWALIRPQTCAGCAGHHGHLLDGRCYYHRRLGVCVSHRLICFPL